MTLAMLAAMAIPVAANDIILISPAPASLPEKWDGTVATAFGGGSGTEADPYLITNAKELALIAQNVNATTTDYLGIYFKQTADINLDGAVWHSIGNGKPAVSFKGNYDGGNFTIYNIFNTKKLLNRAAGVQVSKTSGLAGIAYWINENYGLEGNERLDKKDEIVIKMKEWIDKEYEDGRVAAMSTAELSGKLCQLSGGRFECL